MYSKNLTTKTAPRVAVIDPHTPEKAKLHVAAYARVSSDSTDQLNSYLAQVDFYTKHIAANEDWELVDVYADEGISGLDAAKRDDFNRMIADCRAGKIDRILVKSISRFARNTKDYLQYMRELLRLGVTIQFEKENLDTGKLTSEQTAAIYGAFAQMESTNHSNNMRISTRIRMEKGLFVPGSTPYGYRLENLELVIVPEEAEIVRYIFNSYLSGQGKLAIAEELNELGVERGPKGKQWYLHTISHILTNPTYTGDIVWNKCFRGDTLLFPVVRNQGQKPKYTVKNSHPGIISREDFQRVQDLITVRRDISLDSINPESSVLKSHIFCGECGCGCHRKVNNCKAYWRCNRHGKHKELCSLQQVPEQEIARISEQNLVLVRLQSKGYVDSALYLSQLDELDHKLKDLRCLRRKILESAGEDEQIAATERILDSLECGQNWHDEVTPEFFDELVERIIVVSAEQIKFRLRNGLELTETMERRGR